MSDTALLIRAAIPVHHTATTDASWDTHAALAAAPDDSAVLRYMHAWYAGQSPDTKASYQFAHHEGDTAPANLAACRIMLMRLHGADIPAEDKAAVEAHLRAHLLDNAEGFKSFERPGQARARAAVDVRDLMGGPRSRVSAYQAEWRHSPVVVNGKELTELAGYSSVVGLDYEMYDMWGPYVETVSPGAFDKTLAASPDVAFLVNHKGVTMARTTNGTLDLQADARGERVVAYVNHERTDVRDLVIAIDDKNITEMSFAFMITAGHWSEEYDHFWIDEIEQDRGDVSAVNYGANPYTEIAGRSREWMRELEYLPEGAQRAALRRLAQRFGGVLVPAVHGGGLDEITSPAAMRQAARNQATATAADLDARSAASGGKSIAMIEAMLEL